MKGAIISLVLSILLLLYVFINFYILRNLFLHIFENADWFESLPSFIAAVAYFGIIIFYLGLLYALVKIFFIKKIQQPISVVLTKKKEPQLYSFIEKICSSIGAKNPVLIEATCGTTISIEYKKGFLSFLEEQKTLSISLPLFKQYTLPEFASVVSSEVAHYNESVRSQIYYFIKNIVTLFYNASHKNDAIDEYVNTTKNTTTNILLISLLYLLLFFNIISKKISLIFYTISHAISKSYLSSMDYEADRIASQLVGSEVIESALFKQHLVNLAWQEAYDLLLKEQKPKSNSLPNDFIQLVSHIINNKTPEELNKWKNTITHSSVSSYSPTKPSLSERIQQIRRKNFKCSFTSDKNALSLLQNVDEYSKVLTTRLYREQIQLSFSSEDLVDCQQFLHPPETNEMIVDSSSDNTFF